MACSTLLSILSLCLLASRVVGQTQEFTAEIEAAAARFIRIPLAPLMPGIPLSPSNTTQTILRLREKGLPSAPGLLSLEGESLAGVAPPLLRPLRLEITVAYRESGMLQVARLSLNLTINTQQGTPDEAVQVRITNINASEIVSDADNYAALRTAVQTLAASLPGASGSDYIFLQDVVPGEENPRNVPPINFNPPVIPPNFYINSTALVSLAATDSRQQLTCADLQAANIEGIFSSVGFDVGECQVVDVNLPVITPGAPPSLGSVGGLRLERTREDFDDTVIPTVIVAALILLVGLVLLLKSWCHKRDGEEELLQRQRLILNKLARNRRHAYRFEANGTDYNHMSAYDATMPRQGYLRKHLSDFSDQAHLAAPEEVSLAEEVPPPRYRAPPSHKF